MKLFASLLFLVIGFSFADSLLHPQENTDKVERIIVVRPWESIQAKIDYLGMLGGGGTILLDPEATYRDVALKIPALTNYSYISIIGRNTRLVSPPDSQSSVIHVGIGWDDWNEKKLEGVRLEGLRIEQVSLANPGSGKGIYVAFTKGAVIKDCEFVDCPYESLFEEGGTANERLSVIGCTARGCGRKWSRGPLASFNLNGFGSTIRDSVAVDCGWGLESGGTELRVIGCRFVDAPLALGSTVFGCSNLVLSGNTFENSSITISNGIGRMADVQLLNSVHRNSPICWCGAATTNRVQLPGLPWHDHTSLIAGNTFLGRGSEWTGQAVRLTAWYDETPSMPLKVLGNTFDVDQPGYSVVVQGKLQTPVTFVDNSFPADVGRVYRYLPGVEGVLPDPMPNLRFERNRKPSDAFLSVSDGTKVTRRGVN